MRELAHHLEHQWRSLAWRRRSASGSRSSAANFYEEFKLDPMTLLVRTNCMH